MSGLNLKIKIDNGLIAEFEKIGSGVIIDFEDQILDYPDSFIYPGFTDGHGHISALGAKMNGINLNFAKSAEDCAIRAKNSNIQRQDWILANGWNNELWANNQFPDKSVLDDYFPNNPVCFVRVDGHAAWVNSKALELSGIGSNAKSPDGGIIELDKAGNPTGILHDNAIDIVKKIIPSRNKQDLKNDILTACNELLRNGIVNAHDMDVHPELLKIFSELDSVNELPIMVHSYVSGHNKEWLEYNISHSRNENFQVIGVKFYADGSLGSRSAAMLNDYSDKPGEKGLFLINENELFERAKIAIAQGFHVAVHAIGDSANRMVINTFKKLHEHRIAGTDTILRLEHAQHINEEDLETISKYRIICSIQPIHCISDVATITEARVGERSKDAYRWKSIIDAGGLLISGSDFPIESHNPFMGIDALCNRIPNGYIESWNPDERIDIEYALKSYSLYPERVAGLMNHLNFEKIFSIQNFIILNQKLTERANLKETKVFASYQNKKFNIYK